MTIRTALVLALSVLAAPAFAATTSSFVGGELGYIDNFQSGKTRSAVTQELDAFRANPVGADGARYVGGEQGFVLPSAEGMSLPSAAPSQADRQAFQAQYPA